MVCLFLCNINKWKLRSKTINYRLLQKYGRVIIATMGAAPELSDINNYKIIKYASVKFIEPENSDMLGV